jgi:predicted component of type VI protein secretion system
MRLTFRSGERAGETVDLGGERLVVGREETCDLVLSDEKVSRRHAVLERFPDGRYALRDLGSANGTFVDGTRIAAPVVLEGGEELRLGSVLLAVSAPEPVAARPTVAAGATPTLTAGPAPTLPAEPPPAVQAEPAPPAAVPPAAEAPPAEAAEPPAPSGERPRLLSGGGKWILAAAAVAFLVAAGATVAMFTSGENAALPATTAAPPATTAPPETTGPSTTEPPATTAPETTEPASTVPVAVPGVPMVFTSDQDGVVVRHAHLLRDADHVHSG